MRIILIFIFISAIASHGKTVEFPSGVVVQKNELSCDQLHNVKLACYTKGLALDSCFPGNADENGTISYVVRCSDDKSLKKKFSEMSASPQKCMKFAKTFMNNNTICNISTKDWANYYSCFGADVQKARSTKCSNGCENMPKYHVCDWRNAEYKLYKNCTSLNNSIRNTRESLCPNARPDVDHVSGPPPRIYIEGERNSNAINYLSFYSGFTLNINSITGGRAEYCIHPKGKTCDKFQKLENGLLDNTKYIIKDNQNNFPEGLFVFTVKNKSNKKITSVEIYKHRKNSNADLKCDKDKSGKWIELSAELEYSPILKPNSKFSEDYRTNTECFCIGEEQKDTYGRRWKCQVNKKAKKVIAKKESNNSPGCYPEEKKCNNSGYYYFVKHCWGGADPNELSVDDEKWFSYIYSGQFIKYTNKSCYNKKVSSK